MIVRIHYLALTVVIIFESSQALQGAPKRPRWFPLFSSSVKPFPRFQTSLPKDYLKLSSLDQNFLRLVEQQDLGRFTLTPSVQAPPSKDQHMVPLMDQQQTKWQSTVIQKPQILKDLAATTSFLPKPHSRTVLVSLGCLFALNSGFLNGLGLSGAFGKAASVSAVTGTYTNAAVAFTNDGGPALLTVLATPLFYLLGSIVNGLCNPEGTVQSWERMSQMQSAPLLLAGTLVLVASSLSNIFGRLSCLTFAMGLQNSWTSSIMPGNLLRTAHFSGMTSDFGTILGQTLRGNYANTYKLSIFAKLALSFWVGGMLSVVGVPMLDLAPSKCLRISALWYFGAWSAMTFPLRREVTFKRENA